MVASVELTTSQYCEMHLTWSRR